MLREVEKLATSSRDCAWEKVKNQTVWMRKGYDTNVNEQGVRERELSLVVISLFFIARISSSRQFAQN